MGFSKWILERFGWEIDPESPKGVKKAVVVMGPHTSNWDFIIGRLAFKHYKVKGTYLIKSDLFFWPLGPILKRMGGIPINRSKNNNFTDQAVAYFENNETLFMVFTPEGTRSYNPNWKKGFYYIALKAKVPIYLGYVDFKHKKGGFLERFEPTGDIDKDIRYIKTQLSQFEGRNPEQGIRHPDKE
jgi:1-acyl-sn-glycerol-3-phosphate acyltransferase